MYPGGFHDGLFRVSNQGFMYVCEISPLRIPVASQITTAITHFQKEEILLTACVI
jgi:hypothetical protein